MAEDYTNLAKQLEGLKNQVASLAKRAGGMLSSADFRQWVITREKDADYEELRKLFENRKWDELGKKKKERGFIIDPYDELNMTPFSYDLSIGDEIFSVRKKDRMRKRLPYDIAPGETAILLTKEFIALPPCYSATVWPRFNLVREGIFQSMVKIDPTWYGQLGVAVTNFSPRTINLKEEMAFGTLVLYELCNETDIDLWQPDRLPSVRVKIPDIIPIRGSLQQKLEDLKLTNTCWVEGSELVVSGLKRSSYEKLCSIDSSKPWQDIAKEAKKTWLEYTDPKTKRKSIGMEALEMQNLEKLVEGPPMGEAIDANKVKTTTITLDALYDAAVEYGKPFDLVAAIPTSILQEVKKELVPRIEADVGARLFPQIVQLTLRVLALLSLIGVAVALASKYFDLQKTWIGVVALITIPVMLVVLIVTFGKFPQQQEKCAERKQDGVHIPEPSRNKDIEKEYRSPKLAAFVLRLLSPLKKK